MRVLHFEINVACSAVSAAGSVPSEKNCDSVISRAAQIASKLGNVGALFRLNIFVIVD